MQSVQEKNNDGKTPKRHCLSATETAADGVTSSAQGATDVEMQKTEVTVEEDGRLQSQKHVFHVHDIPFELLLSECGVEDESLLMAVLACKAEPRITAWQLTLSLQLVVAAHRQNVQEVNDFSFNSRHSSVEFALIPWRGLLQGLDSETIDLEMPPCFLPLQVTLSIKHISSYGLSHRELFDFFNRSDELSNVVVSINGKELHLCKEILAANSSFFRTAFYSPFKESSSHLVKMHDVNLDDFIELLYVIYPSRAPVTNANVELLLPLADMLDCGSVRMECQQLLLSSPYFSLHRKIFLADKFGLLSLLDSCLAELQNSRLLQDLCSGPLYENLSASLKIELGEKAMQLLSPLDDQLRQLQQQHGQLQSQMHESIKKAAPPKKAYRVVQSPARAAVPGPSRPVIRAALPGPSLLSHPAFNQMRVQGKPFILRKRQNPFSGPM